MDFNEQITILQENIRMSSGKRQPKLKFVSSDKWRAIMLRAVQRMKTKKIYDSNLLFDLVLIVQSIKDAKFVEAILNLQPFRPNFLLRKRQSNQKKQKEHIDNIEEYDSHHTRTKLASINNFQYRNSIIKLKRSVNQKINDGLGEMKEKHKKSVLEELLCYVTEEETLTREFQGKSHPFRKIIDQYLFLVENKYKNLIEHQQSVKIQEIQEILIVDVKLLQEFIIKSSEPYITIFKTENQEEKIEFQLKMVAFLKQYIQKHEKINIVIRKIMRMASRKTGIVRKLIKNVPDFVQINNFDIKDIYKIDGCYIHSMNALMEFAECTNSKLSLKKLKEFRSCLSKDVDDYYQGKEGAPQNRQICAQTQIQILKFVIAKLKSFLPEIFAQLKFLQVVYGQSDMSFKYDDSSYMYAQVSVALEALQMEFS